MIRGIIKAVSVWREARRQEKNVVKLDFARGELQFLPAAVEILETPASPVGRTTAILLSAVLSFAIAWAYLGHIDTVAVAQGKIIPTGRVKLVQPVEKSMVKAIHVEEGQRVEKGDVLVEFDPTISLADQEETKLEQLTAMLEFNRLTALVESIDTSEPIQMAFPDETPPSLRDLNSQQLKSDVSAYRAQMENYDSRYIQLQADEEEAIAQIQRIDTLLPLVREREKNLLALLKDGTVSKRVWGEAKEQLINFEQDRLIWLERKHKSKAALNAALSEKQMSQADARKEMITEMLAAKGRLERAVISNRRIDMRLSQATLTAPTTGIVQQLQVHTIGGVVNPTDPIMVIVPEDQTLMVEASLANKDVGSIQEGHEVAIKVESFPYTKFGMIDGTVRHISADAVQDEQQGLIYPAMIEMKTSKILAGDKWVDLAPGMSVTAEVKTGKRRVLEYFLTPFLKYQNEALREQ